MSRQHAGCTARIGREQRLVGEDIDSTQQALRTPREHADRAPREQLRSAIAARLESRVQVITNFTGAQRRKFETVGNALVELANLVLRKLGIQLGLPEQHDLQQLVVRGLEIAEEPDLFERRERHALCLFHEHHHPPVIGVLGEQVIMQLMHHQRLRGTRRQVELELVGDRRQDFVGTQIGIRQIDHFAVRRDLAFEHTTQHGLAAADFPHHFHDAFTAADRINQRIEDRAAIATRKE